MAIYDPKMDDLQEMDDEKPSYPELREHVEPLANLVCLQINAAARRTPSEMPYKAQFILECLIRELESRV